jgi:hypothetical protein
MSVLSFRATALFRILLLSAILLIIATPSTVRSVSDAEPAVPVLINDQREEIALSSHITTNSTRITVDPYNYVQADTDAPRYVSLNSNYRVKIFLPVVFNLPMSDKDAEQAIRQANLYRKLVDATPLHLHPAIVTATQAHAQYFLLNFGDQSAQAYGAHGEVEGKPGFTGHWPSDRIDAAGFPWLGGAEVMHFIADPVKSVDSWMATIYHRVIILDPYAYYAGYGREHSANIKVDVMDFGNGPSNNGTSIVPYPLAYPSDRQTGVPFLWDGGEYPNPLPEGATRPVGYPFTLQGVGGRLQVDWAEMRDGADRVVAIHPDPAECATFNCYALIAITPLSPNTRYTVHARGLVDRVPFDRSWQFKTGADIALTKATGVQAYPPDH